MPVYNFTHRDKNVEVEIEFYDSKVQWYLRYHDQDGLLNEYHIIGYPIPVGTRIQVSFAYSLKRPSNNDVLKSYQDTYYENELERFYRMKIGDNEYGQYAGFQAMNGLIARLPEFDSSKDSPAIGYRIFDETGSFYQPIVYDVVLSNETFTQDEGEDINNADGELMVTVLDGVAPYEYQLEQNETVVTSWQSDNHFEGLSAGNYKLIVRDSAGTKRYKNLEIRPEFVDEVPA